MVVDLHTHRIRVGYYEHAKKGRIMHKLKKSKKAANNNRGFHGPPIVPFQLVALYYLLLQPTPEPTVNHSLNPIKTS